MDSADRLWRKEDYLTESPLGIRILKAAAFSDSPIKTLNHNFPLASADLRQLALFASRES
jgi:hypothetical protein